MKSRRSHPRSQLCAAAVTMAAVVALLAPLRQGPSEMRTQHASFIPLLAASGVAESASFHRLATAKPENASTTPQVRVPATRVKRSPPRKVSPAALTHDFQSPRVRWQHLDADTREALDRRIASMSRIQAIELHGSSIGTTSQLHRIHRLVRGHRAGHPYHFVIGDRVEAHTTAPDGDVLHVCVLGDFHTTPPSSDKLAALDEVLDYLSMKIGDLPLRMHDPECLGAAFPAQQILKAVQAR